MKIVGLTGAGILALLAIALPAYAQHDQQGEKQDHHDQQQGQHERAQPQPQHEQRQSAQHSQSAHQQPRDKQDRPQHARQQQKQDRPAPQEHAQIQHQAQANHRQHSQQQHHATAQPQHSQAQRSTTTTTRSTEQHRVEQTAWRQHGSQHWESEHRTWEQRGGYQGYRIPDDRYRGYFGSNHGFRIYGLPFLVVSGYPRFQYQGYWFSPVDPWPQYWGDNWYDNDEVYVNYVDNGYYLYNRRYPTVGIAINVSM